MSARRTLDLRRAALPEVQRARRSWVLHQARKVRRLLEHLDDLWTTTTETGKPSTR